MERLTGSPPPAASLAVAEVLGKLGAADLAAPFRRPGGRRGRRRAAGWLRRRRRADAGGHYAPLVDAAGAIAGALCVVRDVSSQQQLEEQLLQAHKTRPWPLAGGVAHDSNNCSPSPRYCELAELRVDETAGVRSDLARSAAPQRAPRRSPASCSPSAQQVLRPSVFPTTRCASSNRCCAADRRHVELTTTLAADAGRVLVDRNQLHQVLVNLLVNARDAMPGGGKLLIETRNSELDEFYAQAHPGARPGSYVMIAVSDNGTGMDEPVRSRIFEPFFTTKERGKGTGLGLSTVYGIVKQSGGYIWVYSEPGHGTTFKLFLPRVDTAADRRPEEVTREVLTGTETVLVAEDEEVVRGLVVRLLQLHGYRVIAADRGQTALDAARKARQLQLLITDVVMPD